MNFKKVKLITFVPISNAEEVREALGNAGAGKIGEYSFCSFTVTGKGRFKPSSKADPHIGKPGKLEAVDEERIEVVCEAKDVKKILSALKEVHPYEEVAFEISPLLEESDFS